jgi:N-acetylmuramoyl-L-alanine amidase-like protein
VRRLLILAALLGALTVFAGPALSTEAWRPDPVDFELAPPAGAVHASANGHVTSAPLRAPRRFNLVGMRWRGAAEPALHVRVRERGGRWSRWQALDAHADHNPDPRSGERVATASDPLWVGQADDVQYRMDRRVSGLRLHFVNVQGTATRADRVRTALRGAVNAAVTSVAKLVAGGGDATAQDPQPAMVTRAQWGASACPPRSRPQYGTVQAAYVHHTVSLNDYAPDEAPGIVLATCRYHRNSNGWNDIGYNALVDKYGVLYEGRAGGIDKAVVGAQAEGYNAQTTGIASIGNNSEEAAGPEEIGALARFIRWKLGIHAVPLTGTTTLVSAGGASNRFPAGRQVQVPRVLGHRDTGATECPGNLLYEQLDDLRAQVAAGVPIVGSATRLVAYLSDASIDYGEQVRVSGYLGGPDGGPVPAQPVELQTMTEGTWRTVHQLTTNPDGTYDVDLKPRKRMYVRVRFASRASLRGSSSSKLLQRVRPVLTLTDPVKRARRNTRVDVTGTVTPRKHGVYIALQERLKSGRWKRVGLRLVHPRKGVFSASFVPEDRARYRYYAIVKADLDTDRAVSAQQPLTVTR